MKKLNDLKFKGIDIANAKTVVGSLEQIDLNEGDLNPSFAIVINTGEFKSICLKDSIELVESYAILDVKKERQRQDDKWGEQNHNVVEWIAILTEEVGEAAKDAVDFHFANGDADPSLKAGSSLQFERLESYRKEMIQVAAVAISAVESLDRALRN